MNTGEENTINFGFRLPAGQAGIADFSAGGAVPAGRQGSASGGGFVSLVEGLPSGVYFYRLEATNASDPRLKFVEIRKMLLEK